MKKIFSLILALCLLVPLQGCTKRSDSDITTVFRALNRTLQADSLELKGNVEVSQPQKMSLDMSVYMNQKSTPEIAVLLNAEGTDIIAFYLKDHKTYLNAMGTKSQSSAANIGMDGPKPFDIFNPFLDYSDDELIDFFTASSKKGDTYTLTMDPSKLSTALDRYGGIRISKGTLEATVKDDVITTLVMNLEGENQFTQKGMDTAMTITLHMDKYDENVQVPFPDDLNTYPKG